MNDIIFCKNFRFNEFCYDETAHRNNSHGVDFHYIGFMRHGKGRIITNDQVLEIDENEMFYIPKGLKYHSHWIAKDYVRFDSIGFLYFPSIASNGYDLQKIEYNSDILEAFMPLLTNKSINNITIGYSLPATVISKMKISGLRIYVAGDNLAVVSARKGVDPRYSMGLGSFTSGSGLNSGSYSAMRTVTGGITLTF